MEPPGVAAVIIPSNLSVVFIAQKVASAIAAGVTIVVKPSNSAHFRHSRVRDGRCCECPVRRDQQHHGTRLGGR
ncbi:aldehyde dehydrogenase family protein [Streptomyces sp. NPDC006527]|uniref:aldehyde dehydrogenase family protein n=1 Tax=Streptomyces sp. NPDC006527 TaxID=3364749 RepID=UPI003695F455